MGEGRPLSQASQISQGSHRFRESTHLIPTPGYEQKRPPRFEPFVLKWYSVATIILLTIGLGVGLEVALFFSNKKNGFSVPQQNFFSFASAQTLTSFFPTLLVIPVAFLWREMDWMIRWYNPYVLLSKRHAKAKETLLLDYIAIGVSYSLFYALKYRHRLVFISALTGAISYIFQPLAGSVLQILQLPDSNSDTEIATSIASIGLAPDINQLDAFVASAGFVQAAVYNTLPDPPFILGGWAAAEFVFADQNVLNGSISVNTTAIKTTANCANPSFPPVLTNGTSNMTLSASSVGGCNRTVALDPTMNQQYGVVNVPCSGGPTEVTLQPVMFYYYSYSATPQAKVVFCSPSFVAFNIMATANVSTGALSSVAILNNYTVANNVTGSPQFGQAFNAVIFDPSNNTIIQARALATQSGVPDAIFRDATQQARGLQSVFEDPSGFVDLTTKVYTQHLALTAKSIYFLRTSEPVPAILTSLKPKLWIDPLPAHALAIIFILLGVVGALVHIAHRRARQHLWLASPPGSIAAVVSLTARSGFGDLLLPYDDEKAMEKKLNSLRFRLDPRTGAILADDYTDVPFDDVITASSLTAHDYIPLALAHEEEGYPPRPTEFKTPYDG